jgi:hypothetical protein
MMRLVKPGRSAAWTRDRIEALSTAEVRQLRDNAQRLGEQEIVALCEEIVKARPRTGAGAKGAAPKPAAAKAKRPAAA